MSNNEITVKVIVSKEELVKHLEENGFKDLRKFSLDDYYFVPKELDIEKMSTREIISKAILVRDIREDKIFKKKLTYKIKDFDENGDIVSQRAISCNVENIEDSKKFLEAIGYKEIMNIKEYDTVFGNEKFELAVKEIKNGDLLIEVETEEDSEFDTIDKLKKFIDGIKIPIKANEYFVKKAEIELDKILGR